MIKLAIKAGAGFVVISLGIFAYLLFTGPNMRTQITIKPFQAQMPAMPKGSVPVIDAYPAIPLKENNPLDANSENIARGKVYYGYYCTFCHGQSGAGDGPVGYSYIPAPSDLRTDKVKSYSDGELLQKSLTGIGHEPVLNYVIPAEHRWYIELYVRDLGKQN